MNAMQSIGNTRAISDFVLNGPSDKSIAKLEEQKKEINERLDGYKKQENDLKQQQKESKKILEMAEKKSAACKAMLWGTIAATVASGVALGFVCLPALPLLAVGGTFAACQVYKKKEVQDRLLFLHGDHGMMNGKMDMELLKMGRDLAKEDLQKTEKELSALKASKDEKLAALEAGQTEPSQELVESNPEENFITIDGIKLPKRSLEYMTPGMRVYVSKAQRQAV